MSTIQQLCTQSIISSPAIPGLEITNQTNASFRNFL